MKTAFGHKVTTNGLDYRYQGQRFAANVRCIEIYDRQGVQYSTTGRGMWQHELDATSFVSMFEGAHFAGPCVIDLGYYPYTTFDSKGDPVSDIRLDFTRMFADSNTMILPNGSWPSQTSSADEMFLNCTELKYWMPQELREMGLANNQDPDAPQCIHHINGPTEGFFTMMVAHSMKRFVKGCTKLSGHGLNAINWRHLASDDGAEGFAEGCRFENHFLSAIIASIHYRAIQKPHPKFPFRKLKGVNLGYGRLVGLAAHQYHELREFGIEVIVENP